MQIYKENNMLLKEAKEILKNNGYIVEKMEWGSDPKFYSTKTPVKDVGDYSDDDQEVSPVAVEKIKELAERLAEEGFKVRRGISWAGPFVSIKKTKIGPVSIVYEEDDDFFTVECDDGQVYLHGDYEEQMPDFVGFLNGKNNF